MTEEDRSIRLSFSILNSGNHPTQTGNYLSVSGKFLSNHKSKLMKCSWAKMVSGYRSLYACRWKHSCIPVGGRSNDAIMRIVQRPECTDLTWI